MKFSIITITHNRAHLIGETIQSVLNQTETDFEHIIIDDGSVDDTEKVVKNFNDPRIRYFKYEKNGLRSFLRNEGIRKATGHYICILDSDDIWRNDKLEIVNGILNKNVDVDFVIHNIEFVPEGAVDEVIFTKYKTDFSGNVLWDLLAGNILPFPTFTIRAKALTEIGVLDETMIDGQHDLYVRAAAKLTFYYCTEKLATMRKHGQNISKKTDMSHYDDYLKTINKLKLEGVISSAKHKLLMNKIYAKIAYIYYRKKQYNKAKDNYNRSYKSFFLNYSGLKSFLMFLKISLVK